MEALNQKVLQLEDSKISNIPDYMSDMKRERSMKMAIAAVQNVVPKVAEKVPTGGDLFYSPKKEKTYPLKQKVYPQYSPSGRSIQDNKANLKNLKDNNKTHAEELQIELTEYEKTMVR